MNKNHVSSLAPARADPPAMVEVWDLPLRLFHWALAAAVPVAWFSANVFDMVHEIAGYTVLGLIAFRIVWGFTGTRYSRFRSFIQSATAPPSGEGLALMLSIRSPRPRRT